MGRPGHCVDAVTMRILHPVLARGTRHSRIALAAILVLAAAESSSMASPLDLFGFGGRSPGMVGLGVATSTDFDSVFLNPSGLAGTKNKRVTFGGMAAGFSLSMNDRDTNTATAGGVVFGGALPLTLGGYLADKGVTLGLGFHIPTAAINRARHPLPGVPTYALLESRAHVIGLMVAAGARIDENWRAGIGILALAQLSGSIDVTTDSAGRFATRSEQQLLTRFAPIIGVTREFAQKGLTLGATFRGVSRSDYDLVVTTDLGDAIPLDLPTLRIAGNAQYDPLTVAVESAWRRGEVTYSAQLAYQRWSAYPLPTENPVDGSPPQEPPGFHDIVVPRLGAEWSHLIGDSIVALRGGYSFVMTPAPEMSGRQSLLDNHRHVAAIGVGLSRPTARWPVHVNAWLQGHLLAPRSHTKDLDQYMAGEIVPFYRMKTAGVIYVGGLSLGVDY